MKANPNTVAFHLQRDETGQLRLRLQRLEKALGKVPQDMRTAVRRPLREAASKVVGDAKSNASWSDRIVGSFRVSSRLNHSRRPAVFIQVDKGRSPHARAFEGILYHHWRHPVFGNREVWVSQSSRPYLVPALEGRHDEVVTLMESTVAEVMQKLGLSY